MAILPCSRSRYNYLEPHKHHQRGGSMAQSLTDVATPVADAPFVPERGCTDPAGRGGVV
jgi:hypothetical protein